MLGRRDLHVRVCVCITRPITKVNTGFLVPAFLKASLCPLGPAAQLSWEALPCVEEDRVAGVGSAHGVSMSWAQRGSRPRPVS